MGSCSSAASSRAKKRERTGKAVTRIRTAARRLERRSIAAIAHGARRGRRLPALVERSLPQQAARQVHRVFEVRPNFASCPSCFGRFSSRTSRSFIVRVLGFRKLTARGRASASLRAIDDDPAGRLQRFDAQDEQTLDGELRNACTAERRNTTSLRRSRQNRSRSCRAPCRSTSSAFRSRSPRGSIAFGVDAAATRMNRSCAHSRAMRTARTNRLRHARVSRAEHAAAAEISRERASARRHPLDQSGATAPVSRSARPTAGASTRGPNSTKASTSTSITAIPSARPPPARSLRPAGTADTVSRSISITATATTRGIAHLSRADVRAGEYVPRASTIALVGSTGESTGPHLHYQIMLSGHGDRSATPYLARRPEPRAR